MRERACTILLAAVLLLLAGTATTANAQFGDAGAILRAGKADANLLLRHYFAPIGRGFGAGLNAGWTTSAETHGVLGFDLSVNASLASVPSVDQSFNVAALESEFQELEYLGGPEVSPTVAGPSESGSTIGATFTNPRTGQQERLFDLQMPEGTGFSMVPVPMIQGSVGIPGDTDLSVRLLPPITVQDELEVQLFGIGGKKEINSLLPAASALPVTLSLQAGYTQLDATVDFDVQPEVDPETTEDPYPESDWEGQRAEFSSSGLTINALVGKDFPFVDLFGGLGWETSTVELATPGSYPVVVENPDPDPESPAKIVEKIERPVDLSYDGANSVRATVGATLNLFVFDISASYTVADYPVIRGTVGFSFR